jgi:beta-galactosidase
MRILSLAIGILVMLNQSLRAQIEVQDTWKFTLDAPASDWTQTTFDDKSWKDGNGGFGTAGTPGVRLGTRWQTKTIWLRKFFEVKTIPSNLALLMHHDEDVEVYLNGQKIAEEKGFTTDYKVLPLKSEQKKVLLTKGTNLLAVHCKQTGGGQYIDVHIVDAENVPVLPAAKGSLKPIATKLTTVWGEELTAENTWTEYPRPQLVRNQWTNLNGHWDYAISPATEKSPPKDWAGKILVPFSLESKLGGVQRLLQPTEALWYHRTFHVDTLNGDRLLLNFEAVDYLCEVLVNGKSVGTHQGGSTPFSLDVTDAVKTGSNDLVVRVEDKTMGFQLQGKQRPNPEGIWYTQVSGIWQTVWMERVPQSYLRDFKIATDATKGTIRVQPILSGKNAGQKVRLVAKDGDKVVAEKVGAADSVEVAISNAKLWTPVTPFLYQLEVTLLDANDKILDQVSSYAGIRTVGKAKDKDGHWRFTLNGEFVFHWGPLDQGWWPDGLLTPPSDEAMLFDIEFLKDAGFNMIRKHIKVEPRRYYYHCDRLGMMLWQDQVSGAVNPPWTRLAPNPTDAKWTDEAHAQYMLELDRMVKNLENHPSIVVWVPFNEAWGQHRTVEVGEWMVKRDPSRLVNIASGGNFWPVGDVADEHNYPDPAFPFNQDRFNAYVKVVGEFGGHGFPIKNHLWDTEANNWGYGDLPKTEQEYRDRYVRTFKQLMELRKRGIAAGVYTQTTDVEGEINGLITYDRRVIKISAKELKALHSPVANADPKP